MLLTDFFRSEVKFWKAKGDIKKASEYVLAHILMKSSRTKYAKELGLSEKMTTDVFRSAVPIRCYEEYKPWIERIKEGEKDVLWPGLPAYFAITSGTTGEPKTIPITSDFLYDYHEENRISIHRAIIYAPEIIFGKILILGGSAIEGYIKDIPFGSITGILFGTFPKSILSHVAIPSEFYNIMSYETRLYLISRIALESNITSVVCVSPGSLLVLAEIINSTAARLIKEIELGRISNLGNMSKDLQYYLLKNLRPNPRKAEFLKKALKQNGRLIPKDIWSIKLLSSYLKEGSEIQWNKIHDYYGNIKLMDPGIVASEGRCSVGLYGNLKCTAVVPLASFTEFIPVNDINCTVIKSNSETLLPHELCEGTLYSPVLSSANGLIRYSIGDVVKVVKIQQGIPFIEYIGRISGVLSIAGEKLTEMQFKKAIEILGNKGFIILDWAVFIDTTQVIPNYVFVCSPFDLQNKETVLDEIIQELNPSYKRKRIQMLLRPIKIKLLPEVKPIYLKVNQGSRFGQNKQKFLFGSYKEMVEYRPDLGLI